MVSDRAANSLTDMVAGCRVRNRNTNGHRDSREPRRVVDDDAAPHSVRDTDLVRDPESIPPTVRPNADAYPYSKRNQHPNTDRDATANALTNSHGYRFTHSQLYVHALGDAAELCDVHASNVPSRGDRDAQRHGNYHERSISDGHLNPDSHGYAVTDADPHRHRHADAQRHGAADGFADTH